MLMEYNPKIIGYSRDAKGIVVSRHFKNVSGTLCATNADAHRESTVQYVAEPQTCAIRTRSYIGQPASLEVGTDIANALTSVSKDSMVSYAEPLRVRQATIQGYAECPPGGCFNASYPTSKTRRGRVQEGGKVTPALTAENNELCIYNGLTMEESKPHYRIRKLTPRECFRLMDVDDADIDKIQQSGVSKSQQYKMAGNSIVVSCLYHIFHKMFVDTEVSNPIQLSLFD